MRVPIFSRRRWGRFGLLVALLGIGCPTAIPSQQPGATARPLAEANSASQDHRSQPGRPEERGAAKGAGTGSQARSLLRALGDSLSPRAKPKAAADDDPAARALYDRMIQAMRQANSLSYVSHYSFGSESPERRFSIGCTYQAWLKKPNYFRVEATRGDRMPGERFWPPQFSACVWAPSPAPALVPFTLPIPVLQQRASTVDGILIGDGQRLWIHWPKGRPAWNEEERNDPEASRQARLTSYMTKRAPPGAHSIGHEVCYLGAGMSMTVLDLSMFHGYTDCLQEYLDGVKGLGTEKLGDEVFDKIEVSIMKHQRSWRLWLSRKDHLPRKLEETIRVRHTLVKREEWSSVTVNGEIPDALFTWKPPEGWKPWKVPEPEERLLKPGTKAPDFSLASAGGTPIRMADYRGKIVWLYIWRAG